MELRFDAMCTLTWVIQILMRAISNVNPGHRSPSPVLCAATVGWVKRYDGFCNAGAEEVVREKSRLKLQLC